MRRKLNSYNGQKYRWEGRPTHYQWVWVAYYDDINEYIISKYSLEDSEKEADDNEDWEELQDKIEHIRCHDMTKDEIETMIAHQTGNAYYQEFIDIEEERKEDEDDEDDD